MAFPTPIEHLLVLMFENRSFDHLLGFQTGGVDGLRDGMPPGVYPNLDPLTGAPCLPTASAAFLDPGRDPGHEPADVWTQLYQGRRGNAPPTATSLGFMQSYYEQHAPDPSVIMRCFAPDSLRALSTLARSFTVCTHWHSSVPAQRGPTDSSSTPARPRARQIAQAPSRSCTGTSTNDNFQRPSTAGWRARDSRGLSTSTAAPSRGLWRRCTRRRPPRRRLETDSLRSRSSGKTSARTRRRRSRTLYSLSQTGWAKKKTTCTGAWRRRPPWRHFAGTAL